MLLSFGGRQPGSVVTLDLAVSWYKEKLHYKEKHMSYCLQHCPVDMSVIYEHIKWMLLGANVCSHT